MTPTDTALVVAVLALTMTVGAWVGFSHGKDSRHCATGPSPEEDTMRTMHAQCTRESGVWRWTFHHEDLQMEAGCLGGMLRLYGDP